MRYLERKGRDDYIEVSTCRSFEVAEPKSRAGTKKTWDECASQDLHSLNFEAKWAQDRSKSRAHLGGTVQPVLSMERRTLNR